MYRSTLLCLRTFLSTYMYIRTLIGRSGTPVLAIMMLVLCLCYAHGFHANGYSDDLRVVIERTAIKSRLHTKSLGKFDMRCQPSRSVFISSCSECSTAAVPRVHDDVVRHFLHNAVKWCGHSTIRNYTRCKFMTVHTMPSSHVPARRQAGSVSLYYFILQM